MRTIKNLAIPQNSDAKFPFSTIRNETDTQEGTPVVEEIYGDLLTNIYKLLQTVGEVPTGTQDSDTSQYQILKALQLLPNSLNDIEQVLSLNATTWNIPFDLDYLPNKYTFVARAAEDYVAGVVYDFKGSSDTTYSFTSLGFKASDEILVIIDQSEVRAYSLSSFAGNSVTEVFPVFGAPISFNDSNKIWYQESGNLLSDVPSVNYLENIIRVELSNATVILNDIFVTNGKVLCFCLIPATNNYFFRQFSITDLSFSVAVSFVGRTIDNLADNSPYVYFEQGFLYFSNNMNSSSDDNVISKLSYSAANSQMTFVSNITLDVSFLKTTNAVIKSNLLYTMISGALESYNLGSGAKLSLGFYSGVAGQLFSFNGEVYFKGNDVAKKWF